MLIGPLSSRPVPSLLLALILAAPLASAACQQGAETTPPAESKRKRADRPGDSSVDLEALSRELARSYSALSDGDLEAAAAVFHPDVIWHVRTVTTQEVRGREALAAYFRARRTADSRDVGLARVFAGGDDLLIAQGRFVDHNGSRQRVTGFVAFARVEDGQLVEVTEHLAPAQVDTTDPRLPGDPEFIHDDSDAVRQTMAETLDDAWSSNDWGRIDNMFAPEFAYHNLGAGVEATGLKAYREVFERRAAPFPDMSFEIVNSWSTGDWVILEKRVRGTHTVAFGELAPTMRSIEFMAVDVLRFSDDVIGELWSYYDPLAIETQLRAPAPSAPAQDDDEDDEDDEE
ncbi:MAG: ester cyclase [Myxococcales bacterium]|nr:ester cyclase [Myxococcales bacterium]